MTYFIDRTDLRFAGLLALVSVLASAHVILYKRDSRSAVLWTGLVWILPGVGALLYILFGVNRIKRRALQLRERRALTPHTAEHPSARVAALATDAGVETMAPLAIIGDRLTGRPRLRGNRITPLENGDGAYPAMLDAIHGAQRSIALSSFIFASDRIGTRFVEALAAAAARGVEVRVLVDAIGARYSWPTVPSLLTRHGVRVARFLPLASGAGFAFVNLRNHRKILVVDGETAFCGGMNIRDRHILARHDTTATQDVHFRLEGPIAMQLLGAFAEDWCFVTRELLDGPTWRAEPAPRGESIARTITSGPDSDFEVVRHILLAAIGTARTSIDIVTPYFLPDASMIAALAVAALRGVRVRLVLPQRGNIPLVRWAMYAILWQVLKPGAEVYLSPPPFDHSKLLVVDGRWSMLGSTNWDARSLRLNFEVDVECYDPAVARTITALIESRIAASRRITLQDVDRRAYPRRLRDGVARLVSPYL